MTEADRIIERLVIISSWSGSCKTLEQLANVERFTKAYKNRLAEHNTIFPRQAYRVLYHIGIVEGIQLAIRKLVIKEKK